MSDLDIFSGFAAIKCQKIYKYIKVKRSYCRYNAQIGRRLNFSIRFNHTFCQNESQISMQNDSVTSGTYPHPRSLPQWGSQICLQSRS